MVQRTALAATTLQHRYHSEQPPIEKREENRQAIWSRPARAWLKCCESLPSFVSALVSFGDGKDKGVLLSCSLTHNA